MDDVRTDLVRWQSLWQTVLASEQPRNCLQTLAACYKAFYQGRPSHRGNEAEIFIIPILGGNLAF